MKSKILLVEDDEKIIKALTIRLKSQGYDVVVAFDAVMATAQAMQHHPDIILLDISMPGGTGFTVAERLKDSSLTTDIPVIFLTASKEPGLRERAKELGALGYLEKPFEAQDLLTLIQKGLAGQAARS
ncbi:response regulator [Candidatus Nitronereus thalassa]|uniref:Response regulator n=1 Tax=Candidatus Nitronereus thalassa TaxID=3020898 RepID=A0ABU3KB39_9BACT|nr:response regulator [Candidatus Nitronereus thalassa]MDT7043638.1 response regulator [Candidatus Nitronereus thalassa]